MKLNNTLKILSLIVIIIFIIPTLGLILFYDSALGAVWGICFGLFLVSFFIIVAGQFNELVECRNDVESSWSNIDVQLRKRIDLVDNLVNTVKAYAKHEQNTIKEVIEARTNLMNVDTVKEAENANNNLTDTLKSLFAVAESYPELKANTNFLDLQNKLFEIEENIAKHREGYNNKVNEYNNMVQSFPSSIIAESNDFKPMDYLQGDTSSRNDPLISNAERQAPLVKF